jgi:hypothetical protein
VRNVDNVDKNKSDFYERMEEKDGVKHHGKAKFTKVCNESALSTTEEIAEKLKALITSCNNNRAG